MATGCNRFWLPRSCFFFGWHVELVHKPKGLTFKEPQPFFTLRFQGGPCFKGSVASEVINWILLVWENGASNISFEEGRKFLAHGDYRYSFSRVNDAVVSNDGHSVQVAWEVSLEFRTRNPRSNYQIN